MPTYVTNLVQLIGLGIAIDYSLLIVYRFREELARRRLEGRRRRADDGDRRPRGVFSGATVAIGLALLLFMPLAVHALDGDRRLPDPARLDPRRGDAAAGPALALRPARDERALRDPAAVRADAKALERGFWARLSRRDHAPPGGLPRRRHRAARRRRAAGLRAAADTGLGRRGSRSTRSRCAASTILRDAVGPGALSPTQILVDSRPRRRRGPPLQRRDRDARRAAEARPGGGRSSATGPAVRSSTRRGRYAQVVVAGKHEYGEAPAQAFVHRLRGRHRPVRSPGRTEWRCWRAAGPRRGSTSSTAPTPSSRGSCSACWC